LLPARCHITAARSAQYLARFLYSATTYIELLPNPLQRLSFFIPTTIRKQRRWPLRAERQSEHSAELCRPKPATARLDRTNADQRAKRRDRLILPVSGTRRDVSPSACPAARLPSRRPVARLAFRRDWSGTGRRLGRSGLGSSDDHLNSDPEISGMVTPGVPHWPTRRTRRNHFIKIQSAICSPLRPTTQSFLA